MEIKTIAPQSSDDSMNVTIPSPALSLQRRGVGRQPSWMDERFPQLGQAAVRFCTFQSDLAGANVVSQGAIATHHQRLTKTAQEQIFRLRDAPFADGHLSSDNAERYPHGSGESPNDGAAAIAPPATDIQFPVPDAACFPVSYPHDLAPMISIR
ncbi:MAG: hypothetical protein AAF827_07355 [Cyanobacteria bacterium P01_D01_bin.6]